MKTIRGDLIISKLRSIPALVAEFDKIVLGVPLKVGAGNSLYIRLFDNPGGYNSSLRVEVSIYNSGASSQDLINSMMILQDELVGNCAKGSTTKITNFDGFSIQSIQLGPTIGPDYSMNGIPVYKKDFIFKYSNYAL